jgi:hypothetical protein
MKWLFLWIAFLWICYFSIFFLTVFLVGCALPGTIEKYDGYEIHHQWRS